MEPIDIEPIYPKRKTHRKESMLNVLHTQGLLWTNKFSDEELSILQELIDEGVIESVTNAGILFMNGDYCYVLKGNPAGVFVRTRGNESWLDKRDAYKNIVVDSPIIIPRFDNISREHLITLKMLKARTYDGNLVFHTDYSNGFFTCCCKEVDAEAVKELMTECCGMEVVDEIHNTRE